MSTTHDDTAPLDLHEERIPIATLGGAAIPSAELELVAHRVGGALVVSWRWRGRLLVGVEPYVAGSDEAD